MISSCSNPGIGIAAFAAEMDKGVSITFYDSVTGKPLFIAPRGRTMEEFKKESRSHGWPSFRDEEVVWDNMRCLADGESVSVDGTNLGITDTHSELLLI